MCMICAAQTNTDPLAGFDQHQGTGDGFGGGATSAPYTMDQIAGYLTDGYWNFNSETWRAFALDTSRTLTYNTSFLSTEAKAIAEYALDVWASVTGINFVNTSVAPATFNETTDVNGTTASTRTIAVNQIVNGSISFNGDEDFYRVSLTAGQTYTFTLGGTNTDVILKLLSSNGSELEFSDASDPASPEVITFTATTTGTYFVVADGYETSTGAYQLNVSVAADLYFSDLDPSGAYAFSDITGNTIDRSYINIHDSWDTLSLNSYMLQTYVHELGHALGLGHAGPYNGNANWPSDALYDNDSWSATVMSYFDQGQNTFDPNDYAYLATIMPADIIAIQNLYGTGTAGHQTGNTVWGPGGNIGGDLQYMLNRSAANNTSNPFIYDGNAFAMTIYDTDGIDTFSVAGFASGDHRINLNELAFSSIGGVTGNVVIARGTQIENAIGGTGNDSIIGNAIDNDLRGGSGNDTLEGGAGFNYLHGGLGNDRLVGTGGTSVASYATSAVAILADLQSSGSNIGADAVGDIYVGMLGLEGSNLADTLRGNASGNYLYGGNNADLLDGRSGNDSLLGGSGNDTFIGGAGADTMDGGTGFDWVSYIAATGALRVDMATPGNSTGDAAGDTFTLIDGVLGSDYNDTLTGNGQENQLVGNLGSDQLLGMAGNDRLQGLDGNDTLRGDIGADALEGGNGIDIASYAFASTAVRVSLTSPLTATGEAVGDTFSSIEGLEGSAFNDTLSGDALNNVLIGNAGNDTLLDTGGNDRLQGMVGNDTLRGGLGADTLDGGDGADFAIYTTATAGLRVELRSYLLNTGEAAGDRYVGIEGLQGSSFNDTLGGDYGDNLLYGNGGDDFLVGLFGADDLRGHEGNDTLRGDSGADTLYGGDGFDWADYTSATIGLRVNMTNAALSTGDAAGDVFSLIEGLRGSSFADTLVGDAADNQIIGNSGADLLQGMAGIDRLVGGNGNDTISGGGSNDFLTGGANADHFLFDTALGSNIDKITDFVVADDTILMQKAVFTALTTAGVFIPGFPTALAANAFTLGTAATTADHRIIYNAATGQLYYDADGNGAGARAQFAAVTAGLALTSLDFLVI